MASAADERVKSLKLRFEIERSATNQALKTIDVIKRELNEIAQAEKQITPAAVQAGASMVRANEQAKKSAVEAAKANEQLNKSLKDTGFLSEDTKKKLGTIRTENRAESFATRTVANLLPGNLGGQASQIFELIDAIPDLDTAFEVLKASIGDTIGALGATGVGLVGGLLALGAAIAFFQSQNEKASESVKTLISTQEAYYKALGGTRDQLVKARDAQQESVNQLRARVAENQSILNQFEQEVGGVGRALADATDLGGARTLREETQKLEGELKSAEFLLGRYNSAIENNGTATADAAAELERFNQFMQDLTDKAAQARLQANIETTTLDSEAARKRLDAIQTEIDYTEQSIETENLSADAVKQLTDRLLVLRTQAGVIKDALAGIDARTQRAAAIEATKKYNADITKINEQARDAETAANQKYADTLVQIAERAADAADNALRKLQEKRADLALGLSRDFADAELQNQRDQLDAQIKFQDEEAKSVRAHVSELRRIRLEGQRDEDQAIQDRDAVALDAAQTRTRQELNDANQKYMDDAQERAIAYAQELRDQRTQYAREQQDRLTKYARDLQDAQTQYTREIQLAEANRQQALARAAQAYQIEQQQIAQKYDRERALRRQAITAELSLIATGYAQRARVQAMYENQLVAQSQRILSSLSAYGSGRTIAPTQDTGTVIPFARGGSAPPNRTLLVGERGPEMVRFNQPSRIYNANQTRQMGGGRGITLNLQGATHKTIEANSRKHAEKIFGDLLDEMGVA